MKGRLPALPSLLFVFVFATTATPVLSGQVEDTDLYRTYDGQFNNPDNPFYGARHTALQRISGQGYVDGMAEPVSVGMPNPRTVSNALFAQEGLFNDPVGLSDYTWVFGQFMDHDLGLTEEIGETFNIRVPAGDPQFDPLFFGTVEIPLTRNAPQIGTGTAPGNPRMYANENTAFIDGSAVYGSDLARANWLRSFQDGKLKVSAGDMLPYNTVTGEIDGPEDPNAPHMANGTGFVGPLFVAGDVRANENPLLLTCHLLFVREHNRQCDLLKIENPDWNDEELYQHARKIVGGLIQSITYNEWLPTMGVEIAEYSGYDVTENPQLANVFTAAAFRVGHTLLNANIRRLGATGQVLPEGNMTLRQAFFDVTALEGIGIDPYLRGMAEQTQQQMDSKIVDDVRNFLFGPPGAGGLDLAAINIARGRDRGLNTYNAIRQAYGLDVMINFTEMNPDPEVYEVLQELYDNDINKVDPWVGMLAERSESGGIFGPTIRRIMAEQFRSLRDGDRFFYLNDPLLSPEEKQMISETSFRDVIMYNSGVLLMQDNVFESMPFSEICGNATVSADGWINVHSSGERLSGVTVNVVGSDGIITNSAQTSDLGFFEFDGLPACDPTQLQPSLTGEWSAGIDIVDIVAIRRALLGIEPFTSPYQYLAGDANADGTMDVLDIIALSRLLLDIDQELVPGTDNPWRFVAGAYTFENPTWPFLDEVVPATINFADVDPVDINQGFIAYKLGDVNADVSGADNRAPGLLVNVPETDFAAGQSRLVEIALTGESVAGFDLSLTTVSGRITRIVDTDLPADSYTFNGEKLHVVALENGAIHHTITVEVLAAEASNLTEMIAFGSDGPSLAVDGDGNPRSIILGGAAGAMEVVRSEVYPNPFVEGFRVSLSHSLLRNTTAELLDVNGRLVARQLIAAGASSFEVNGLDLPQGTYLLNLISQEEGLILSRKLTR